MPGLACYLGGEGRRVEELEGLGRTEDKGWRLTTESFHFRTQFYVGSLSTLRGGRVCVENLLKESSDSEEEVGEEEEEAGLEPRDVL